MNNTAIKNKVVFIIAVFIFCSFHIEANNKSIQNADTLFSKQSIQLYVNGINKPYRKEFKNHSAIRFSLKKDYSIVLIYLGLGTIVLISLLHIVHFKEMGKESVGGITNHHQ